MSIDAHHVASADRGSRANRPGSRRLFLTAAVAALALAVIVVLAISSGGSSAGGLGVGPHRATHYGQDHWIKIPEPPVMTTPVASAARPDLSAMEGYPVQARLDQGSADIFVAGPAVPNWVSQQASAGVLKSTSSVPATFTVAFSAVHGRVPLSAGAFSIITYQGRILHPVVRTAGGAALPASLAAGHRLELTLRTALPEGDGSIRWAPDGKRVLVGYFWTLEFD